MTVAITALTLPSPTSIPSYHTLRISLAGTETSFEGVSFSVSGERHTENRAEAHFE